MIRQFNTAEMYWTGKSLSRWEVNDEEILCIDTIIAFCEKRVIPTPLVLKRKVHYVKNEYSACRAVGISPIIGRLAIFFIVRLKFLAFQANKELRASKALSTNTDDGVVRHKTLI